jgi:two-component system, repressor protein LuxO
LIYAEYPCILKWWQSDAETSSSVQIMNSRLLVVDDDETTRLLLDTYLSDSGFSVDLAEDASQMRCFLKQNPYPVVFLDLQLPDADGLDLIPEIKRASSDCFIIIITAHGSIEKSVKAMKLGAHDFCTKPIELNRLNVSVNNAIEHYALKRKVSTFEKTSRKKFCDIIGSSPEMQVIYHIIETVAPTNASVLITGESGCGKELVAKAIHQLSPRKNKELIDLNCAAIPKDLLESEMFGHERSAFTGANRQYMGRCEQADQSTLFLDEIAEMDLNLQPKLLRFLQEQTFYRVGGKDKISVDVRVVSATNRNPMHAIKEAQLREDLYYRLNVVNIHIPPLREHKEDIKDLAEYFLHVYSRDNGKDFTTISAEAMRTMKSYQWPGNVRELENCIQQSVVLNTGETLEKSMLPDPIRQVEVQDVISMEELSGEGDLPMSLPSRILPISEYEKKAIEHALHLAQGNIGTAAEGLQLSPATLYRKIREFGLNIKDYKIQG